MGNERYSKKVAKKVRGSVKTKLIISMVALVATPLIIAISISYGSSMKKALSDAEYINSKQCTIVEQQFMTVIEQQEVLGNTVQSVNAMIGDISSTVDSVKGIAQKLSEDMKFFK